MKNLKTIIAVVALSLATVLPAAANTNPSTKKEGKSELRTTIVSLLGKHKYELNKTVEAQVSVLLNNSNELVVVGVNAKDESVASFVKAKLNYKKVDVKGIKKGTVYRVPLKMVKQL
jgi:hypothetical protein